MPAANSRACIIPRPARCYGTRSMRRNDCLRRAARRSATLDPVHPPRAAPRGVARHWSGLRRSRRRGARTGRSRAGPGDTSDRTATRRIFATAVSPSERWMPPPECGGIRRRGDRGLVRVHGRRRIGPSKTCGQLPQLGRGLLPEWSASASPTGYDIASLSPRSTRKGSHVRHHLPPFAAPAALLLLALAAGGFPAAAAFAAAARAHARANRRTVLSDPNSRRSRCGPDAGRGSSRSGTRHAPLLFGARAGARTARRAAVRPSSSGNATRSAATITPATRASRGTTPSRATASPSPTPRVATRSRRSARWRTRAACRTCI